MGVAMRTPQKRSFKILQQILYEIWNRTFDSLDLKYKECFNKSLTVVFEIEIAFFS